MTKTPATENIERDLAGAGFGIESWYGVRVFNDAIDAGVQVPTDDDLSALLDAEDMAVAAIHIGGSPRTCTYSPAVGCEADAGSGDRTAGRPSNQTDRRSVLVHDPSHPVPARQSRPRAGNYRRQNR